MSHPFDRYSAFTDVAVLKEISGKSLRKSMRVNTLKCTPEEFQSWAKHKDWQIGPVPWCPEGFFVDRENRDEALGKDLLHVLGYVYMQEAASMLPVALLDPQPGDMVLDMSAAPGSKTTQIGARMQGRGLLFANDVQEKRIWSLLSNLQRCGVTNVLVTRKVGQWFAGNMTEYFDRVLCDAPCTAQGTARKDSDALQYCSMENIGKMARLQKELLESAVHAAKVGGRIVYSTCTLTPEENEEVVASVVKKFEGKLEVLDPTEWKVKSEKWKMTEAIDDSLKVQESLKNSFPSSTFNFPLFRLWPQTYDTEGFFSAVLQKVGSTKDRVFKDVPTHKYPFVQKTRMKEIADRLTDWYGCSFIRDDEVFIESKEQLLVLPGILLEKYIPLLPYFSGLPFGKYTSHGLPRLSHEMTTLRGHEAQKQVLHLTLADLRKALAGVNLESVAQGLDDGDVLLGLEDNALTRTMIFGRGMLKNGTILNRLPREIVKMFT